MAIVQISQIQIRRGLHEDLPQLASAEMGWSIDKRRLFIGNGTIQEGAPTEGKTEILTEYSNFLSTIPNYTFTGTDAGYTSQTGPNSLNPVNRTLQSVLDDTVTVRDFGAIGNGVADDTAAINRAIQQIYVSSLNGTHTNVQRTIKFPAGTYLVSDAILIPPNCTLIGDGKNNTVIQRNDGTVFQTADSLYQTGGQLGNNGAILPSSIYISGVTLSNSGTTDPAALVVSASDVVFDRISFIGGSYNASVTGTSSGVQFTNSTFTNYATGPINIANTVIGTVSRSNYFDTFKKSLTAGSSNITTVGVGAGQIEYELSDLSNNYRIGIMKYSNTGSEAKFDDEFTEPTLSLGANIFINDTGTLTCTVSGTSTFKYNIKQFI